jgi:hypothetical protein
MRLSRRSILRFGLGGAVVLTGAGLGLGLQSTQMVPTTAPLVSLSPREYSILVAVSDALLPGNGGDLPAAHELGVVEGVDALLARMSPIDVAEFQSVLMLIENAIPGFLFNGGVRPFSQYDLATRQTILKGWRDSRITLRRSAFRALHGLCNSVYWSNSRVHSAIGYPGPPDFRGMVVERPHPGKLIRSPHVDSPDTPEPEHP